MKKLLSPILLASAITIVSCQGKGKPSEPSVKEEKANTNYKSAFDGQT